MGILRRSVAAIGASKPKPSPRHQSEASSPSNPFAGNSSPDAAKTSSIGTSDNVHPDTLNLGAVKGHRLSDDNTAGQTDSTEVSRKQQPVTPKSFRFMLPLSASHARGRRTKDVFGRLSSSQKHDQSHRTESALDGASHSERTGGSSDDSPTHHSAANSPHISSRTAAIHARTLAAAEAESARKAAPQSNAEPETSAVNSHLSTGGGSMTLSAADSIDIPEGGIQVLLPDRPDDQGYRGRKSVSSSSVSPASPSSIHGIEQVGLSEHWMIDYSAITLGKTIGHSSFGMVNEGRLNGTKVAIKTIKRDEAKGPGNDIEAFKKEAELNCKLRHPNVVLFMGICVQPKEVCIVTELMARGNVHDLLVAPIKGKSVKLRWGLRLQWAIDTAQGMAYLHSLHPVMIHRDLKTTNLLVDRGMNVKICDFGLSRFQAEDKIMTAVGTVQFAAPEVLRHEKYTEKADLFSFGTVLWELYTRKTIFDGLPQILVYKSVVEGDMPKVDKGCDPRYSQLIRDCWQLDASKRPSFRDCLDRLTPLAEELSENEYQQ